MTISLPEERVLLGKPAGAGGEPIQLDARDDELSRYKERARVVFDTKGKFTSEEMHQVLARLVLWL